jgi:CO/xanthine dehydrogenase FAD-binding subunit
MKPRFRLPRSTSFGEALDLTAQFGDGGRPLAGGQSLVPLHRSSEHRRGDPGTEGLEQQKSLMR